MNNSVNKYSQSFKAKALQVMATTFLAVSITGCGGDSASDNGQIVNQVALPSGPFDSSSLYCQDVGVGEENCVLYDPANPYARSAINEGSSIESDANYSPASKWALEKQADTKITDIQSKLKTKFYLWATILAKAPSGENQFYTALSLHQIYSNEGSEFAQKQAKLAYRSALDNFFGSVTFTELQARLNIRDMVANHLVNPSGVSQLYGSKALAIQALDDWGYVYSPNPDTVTKKIN